jgi:hypothetical protein
MKKCILTLFALITITYSDDFVQFKGHFFLNQTSGFPVYDVDVFKRIGNKLGLEEMKTICPECRVGYYGYKKYPWGFIYMEQTLSSQFVHPDLASLKSTGDSTKIYGVRIIQSAMPKYEKNSFLFINSAYIQESNPEMQLPNSDYFDLREKDIKELNKRIWISTGYACNYIYKNNPFYDGNRFTQFSLYLVESLAWAAIVTSPIVESKKANLKVINPILGAALLLELKWLMGRQFKQELRKNNAISKSGYRIPRTVNCPHCN